MPISLRRAVPAIAAFAALALGPTHAVAATDTTGSAASVPAGDTAKSPLSKVMARSDSAIKKKADATRRSAAPEGSSARVEANAFPDVTELPGYCPTGTRLGTMLNQQSFESGLPYPGDSYGFTRSSSGGATLGSYNASSTISSGNSILAYLNSSHVKVPAGAKIGLAFSYKGGNSGDTIAVSANNWGTYLYDSPDWTTAAFDVTSEAATNGGYLDAFFMNDTTADTSQASVMRVDNVRVYTCVATTYKRGDWNGDGRVDLMGIQGGTGDHYLYSGKGTGAFGSATKVGSGWNGFAWAGSPGDVNNDNRSDILGVRNDGALYLYTGKGGTAFNSARLLGHVGADLSIVGTPGDMNADGLVDLLARNAAGDLIRMSFDTFGNLLGGAAPDMTTIGWKWNGMAWIIGMGDLNSDGRGDLVGVSKADGCIYAYNATATGGLGSGRKLGCGWRAMTYLTSPGDTTGDGYGDLVARRSDGTLWTYPGRAGGGTGTGRQIGTGWNGMRIIF